MMRTAFGLRLVLAFTLMGWGQFVFASPYLWTSDEHGTVATGNSPTSACTSWLSKRSGFLHSIEIQAATPLRAFCWYDTSSPPGKRFVVSAFRSGNSCENPDATYNPQTGECVAPEPDKCEPTIGVDVEHRHRAGEFTAAGVIAGRVDPPGSVCRSGCQYAFSGSAPMRAYRFENGDPIGVFLTFNYKGNGVSCTGNESDFAQPSDPAPVVEEQTECTTKITDAEGRERYDCQSIELTVDPGNMNCSLGTANGELLCVPKPPSPQLTDKKVKTDFIEKTNPDGSKDKTTITTTTKTVCFGVGSCQTTNTTSVSNNHTKSDGSAGDSSGSCVGPDCKGADGKTQEERAKEEEGDEEGEDYGEVDDGDAGASGEAAGSELADLFTEKADEVLKDSEEASQDFLDQLPSTVADWFGLSGQNVGLDNVIDRVLPTDTACIDYEITIDLERFKSRVVIPFCELTRIKPLLEWIIWCITGVGLWRILYAALRKEDVKAERGGF